MISASGGLTSSSPPKIIPGSARMADFHPRLTKGDVYGDSSQSRTFSKWASSGNLKVNLKSSTNSHLNKQAILGQFISTLPFPISKYSLWDNLGRLANHLNLFTFWKDLLSPNLGKASQPPTKKKKQHKSMHISENEVVSQNFHRILLVNLFLGCSTLW